MRTAGESPFVLDAIVSTSLRTGSSSGEASALVPAEARAGRGRALTSENGSRVVASAATPAEGDAGDGELGDDDEGEAAALAGELFADVAGLHRE